MMDWLALVTAFGFGSIVSVLIQAVLSQRGQRVLRDFEERKAAYIGFWEAIRRQDRKFDEGSKIDLGHWIVRCELVAPVSVREALDYWNNMVPDDAQRPMATAALKESMRKDLGISR